MLAHTGDPQTYAETLAALAIPGLSPAHAAAAMANHQLVTRIRQILNLEERSMTISGKMLSLIGRRDPHHGIDRGRLRPIDRRRTRSRTKDRFAGCSRDQTQWIARSCSGC